MITFDETKKLLVEASLIDARRVDAATITAWGAILGSVTYEEARFALLHHRRTQPGVYLEPGHLVVTVMRWRREASDANPGAPLAEVVSRSLASRHAEANRANPRPAIGGDCG